MRVRQAWRLSGAASIALLSFACGQLLGLDEFEDGTNAGAAGMAGASTGGTGGVGASAGNAGQSASGGIGGSAGSGGGSGGTSGGGGSSGSGPTYGCTAITGSVELLSESGAISGILADSLHAIGSGGRGYVAVSGQFLNNPALMVSGMTLAGGELGSVVHQEQVGGSIYRTIVPGMLRVVGSSLRIHVAMSRAVSVPARVNRLELPLDAAGNLPASAAITKTVLAQAGACDSPEALFRAIAFAPTTDLWFAWTCFDNFSKYTKLVLGDAAATTSSLLASGSGETPDLATVNYVRVGPQHVLQMRGAATYRFGTDDTSLSAKWNLDLNQAAGDQTRALAIAPSADGTGVVLIAARYANGASVGDLWSGVIAGNNLSELSQKPPPSLSQQGQIQATGGAVVRPAVGDSGIAIATPSATLSGVLLHWFARDGSPRVTNYEVDVSTNMVHIAAPAILQESATEQTIAVFWYEIGAATRVLGRVLSCKQSG